MTHPVQNEGNGFVFFYSYEPNPSSAAQQGSGMGGFKVEITRSGEMFFTLYNILQQVHSRYTFQLHPSTLDQLRFVMQLYNNTLKNCEGMLLSIGNGYVYRTGIGIEGIQRPIWIDDMENMINEPYRTARAHYAKLLMAFMEDVATVLESAGYDVSPCWFKWNQQFVQPVDYVTGAMQKVV